MNGSIIFCFCLVFLGIQAEIVPRLNVTIHYASLCPDSRRFIINQLHPTFLKAGGYGNPYFSIDYVPYGKATTERDSNGDYTFKCRRGPPECAGNQVHACALLYLPPSSRENFIECSMAAQDPPTAGPECAAKLGVDFTPVENCLARGEGITLHAQMGFRMHALNPSLYWIPWIMFDGVWNKIDFEEGEKDFMTVLCRRLGDYPKPPACAEIF